MLVYLAAVALTKACSKEAVLCRQHTDIYTSPCLCHSLTLPYSMVA
jgi:hypothetical protein